MGFFGTGDKTNTTTSTQLGASEDGMILTGGSNAAKDSATVVATGSGGATRIGTSDIIAQNGNLRLGSTEVSGQNNKVTFGVDPLDFVNGVTGAVSNIAGNIGDIVKGQTAAGTAQINSTLASLGDLAMSKSTDGQSNTDKSVLYFGLGALALVAFIFYRK